MATDNSAEAQALQSPCKEQVSDSSKHSIYGRLRDTKAQKAVVKLKMQAQGERKTGGTTVER